jgi:hypothetical protein
VKVNFYKYIIIYFLPIGTILAKVDSLYSPSMNFEDILEEASVDEEDSQLIELLESIYNNPLNINTTSVEELLTIPLMDISTAQKIVSHRKRYGDFFTEDELYSIKNIRRDRIKILLPFLTTTEAEANSISQKENKETDFYDKTQITLRSRAINKLQTARGFSENAYQGSKIKSYQRLKIDYTDKYRFGILSEKDAGETSFSDFASAHLEINDLFFENKIIAGDYLIEFGQGLAVWSPYAFSKGSDAVNTAVRSSRGLSAYTSADENQFFRGGAFYGNLINTSFTIFYSSKKRDANIENDKILSLPISGYHRTENEYTRKNSLHSSSFGTILNQRFSENLNVGFLYYSTKFSKYFAETNEPFSFSGNSFDFYSASYQFIFNELYLSGEFAYNGISVASINSLQLALHENLLFATSMRSYPRNFNNLFSQGFGESGTTQNEIGFYSGISWNSPIGDLDFYFDQFKFPYSSYFNPLPSSGNEFMFKYEIPLSEITELSLRYKQENKELRVLYYNQEFISDRVKRQFRTGLELHPSSNIRLRTRFDYVNVEYESAQIKENGFLIFEDIRIRIFDKIDIYGRIIFFNTDSYESRVYEFENDLRGRLTNKSLFGEGLRWYSLIKYEFLNNLELSVKYSETYKPNEISLSSGYNELPTNVNNQISIQIDARF